MVAKSLDLSNRRSANMADKRKQMDMYDFPEHDCTRNKTVAHTFIPSLDNPNGRFRQERLFRSRSHFPSLFDASLYYLSAWKSRANFKVPIYPVNQRLNQPLVEPFENNLKQNSSIKWLFPGGGGHLGIFWVGMCRPGLQTGTPF